MCLAMRRRGRILAEWGCVARSGGIFQATVAALAVLVLPALAPEPRADCKLERVGGYTHSRRFDSLNYIHRASGGIDYRCTDGTRILADSAVVYEHSDQVQLFGRVRFQDPETELDADSARYHGNIGQLVAWSNVTVTDRQSGAVIRGDSLYFYRATEFRPMDRILVKGGNPHATVFPAPRPAAPAPVAAAPAPVAAAPDSATTPEGSPGVLSADSAVAGTDSVPPVTDSVPAAADAVPPAQDSGAAIADSVPVVADSVSPTPYEIDADRFMIDGRRFLRAGGDVVLVRDSLRALGDSLDYDQDVGAMSVWGSASVENRGFALTGASVWVTPTVGLNEEILARDDAELLGSQVTLTAPAIRVFLDNGEVNRLIAISSVPPLEEPQLDTTGFTPGDVERARAIAALTARADSLDTAEDSVARPLAIADDFQLTGDSIDVSSPDQVLDVVTAIGSARAEAASSDSLVSEELPEFANRDWMEGDTIIAQFGTGVAGESTPATDSAAAGDSTNAADLLPADDSTAVAAPSAPGNTMATAPAPQGGRPGIETLTAIGKARSLYRMIAPDTTETAPDYDRNRARHDRSRRGHDRSRAESPTGAALGGRRTDHHLSRRAERGEDGGGRPDGGVSSGAAASRTALRLDGHRCGLDGRRPGLGGHRPGLGPGPRRHHNRATDHCPAAQGRKQVTEGVAVAAGSVLKGENLTKIYKKRRVVSDVDIEVKQREIVALLGPNGAGKTTTFYMLVGLISPDGGKVYLDQAELTRVPMYKRARLGVGYLAQEPSVFRRLTVAQNVMAILETLNLSRKERNERLEELLAELSIGHLRNAKAFSLSGGERRRVEITRALVQKPKFMLLDEPFAGIDPIALHDIQQIVSELKNRNIGVIISDHNVEQTLEIVDRAYIMHEGQIRVGGTVSELVWNDEVANLYLGPTLTVRMRSRFPSPGA